VIRWRWSGCPRTTTILLLASATYATIAPPSRTANWSTTPRTYVRWSTMAWSCRDGIHNGPARAKLRSALTCPSSRRRRQHFNKFAQGRAGGRKHTWTRETKTNVGLMSTKYNKTVRGSDREDGFARRRTDVRKQYVYTWVRVDEPSSNHTMIVRRATKLRYSDRMIVQILQWRRGVNATHTEGAD